MSRWLLLTLTHSKSWPQTLCAGRQNHQCVALILHHRVLGGSKGKRPSKQLPTINYVFCSYITPNWQLRRSLNAVCSLLCRFNTYTLSHDWTSFKQAHTRARARTLTHTHTNKQNKSNTVTYWVFETSKCQRSSDRLSWWTTTLFMSEFWTRNILNWLTDALLHNGKSWLNSDESKTANQHTPLPQARHSLNQGITLRGNVHYLESNRYN